jgi:hypothetical protein
MKTTEGRKSRDTVPLRRKTVFADGHDGSTTDIFRAFFPLHGSPNKTGPLPEDSSVQKNEKIRAKKFILLHLDKTIDIGGAGNKFSIYIVNMNLKKD